jgi:hypothetical protein
VAPKSAWLSRVDDTLLVAAVTQPSGTRVALGRRRHPGSAFRLGGAARHAHCEFLRKATKSSGSKPDRGTIPGQAIGANSAGSGRHNTCAGLSPCRSAPRAGSELWRPEPRLCHPSRITPATPDASTVITQSDVSGALGSGYGPPIDDHRGNCEVRRATLRSHGGRRCQPDQ